MRSEFTVPAGVRRRSRVRRHAIVLACALAACVARASTADDLAQIEAQHAVLKARLRVLETRAQMAAREADIQRYAPAAERGGPSVESIEGVDGRMQATVLLANGRSVEVVAGDVLPNGMRVVSIRPDGVVVQRLDKKRLRLPPAAMVRDSDAGGQPIVEVSALPRAPATPAPMATAGTAPAMAAMPLPHAGAAR